MSTPTYDSRQFVNKLTAAGMPADQADVVANENVQLITEHVASKTDVVRLESKIELGDTRMTARIDVLEAKLESRDARLLLRLAGLLVAVEALFRLI